MNQEKIGKFILENRKKKNMTQSELAEKLGVSDRTVGNWENGRNMPDLSLFKPLCEELGITINEFLSGETLKKEIYQEKLEENIINTIDYSTKKINISNKHIGVVLIILGIIISFSAFSMFASDSSWGSVYSVIGCLIALVGINKLTKKIIFLKRLVIISVSLIVYLSLLLIIDYIGTTHLNKLPRFCYLKNYEENVIECKKAFLNVYWVNPNEKNEYVIVDKNNKYTIDTIPNVPFNRNKSGIDNIIKYKNQYIGNNVNVGNLIDSLPLSEFNYVFEIDSDNLGLIIDYHITNWYLNEDYYLEKSLLYNSVSIFALIENVEYIKYNFTAKSYMVKRSDIENNYPNYNEITNGGISKEAFNKYLESKINDMEFVEQYFNKTIKE